MRQSFLIGLSNALGHLLSIIFILAPVSVTSQAETGTSSVLVRLFSEPVTVPKGDEFSSPTLDEIVDTIYFRTGLSATPTARRFSEVYSDMLSNIDFTVQRKNYPQEDQSLSRSANVLFNRWTRSNYVDGKATVRSELASRLAQAGDCAARMAPENPLYHSSIRIFDYKFDFSCIYAKMPDADSRTQLQELLREISHSNLIMVHGAQEILLSNYIARERAKFSLLSTRPFKLRVGGDDLQITYDQVLVRRGWLDESFWSLMRANGFRFLRNEFGFNVADEKLETSPFCLVREVGLLCQTNDAQRICRIDNARCEPLPERLFSTIANK